MISNKLISEVLEKNIGDAVKEDNNICYYNWSNNGSPDCINIDTLVRLCKEWAKTEGYLISSNVLETEIYPTDENGWILKLEHSIVEETEAEAVIEACEWILEKKKNDK